MNEFVCHHRLKTIADIRSVRKFKLYILDFYKKWGGCPLAKQTSTRYLGRNLASIITTDYEWDFIYTIFMHVART